ncbi:MAG: hypothetical protein EU541_08215 [Promethearchaeota archaeon]|nr:MAG: hypothetical protein EU541_08215 [Candidatus Lokiarchaeota archaeon]
MENQFAKQKVIQDITNEDVRVQVNGYIKNIQDDNAFILDDKSGELKVDLESLETPFEYEKGDLVKVIGDLRITTSGEKILNGEIILDISGLNFKYYQKLYQLKKDILQNENV